MASPLRAIHREERTLFPSRMGVPPLSFLPQNGNWLLLGHVGDWNAFPGTPDLFSCFGVSGGSFSESTQ